LDQEAKRRGLTSDQLLKLEVDAKISDPTPGEIEAYYLAQRLTQPLETVQVQISQNIRQARAQKARADWIRSLRQAAKVDILLGPPRTEVEMDESRRKGGGRAPVTIVEFGDFECPFCRQAEATVKEVLAKYGDRVQFSFRDYPLRSIHPSAQGAAEAARCALEQGKFWEYHDLLFANPDKLNRAGFLELGGKIGLDSARLGRCMDEGAHGAAIEKDVQSGTRAGVNATPAFFVNGILLTGAQPASAFERLIDEELRRQR